MVFEKSAHPTTRQSRNIIFPSELTDMIIDHCHADYQTLASCSLVSKEWLPCSRYHGFTSIKATEKNSCLLVALLEHPNCTFASYVQELILDFTRGFQGCTSIIWGMEPFLRVVSLKILNRKEMRSRMLLRGADWRAMVSAFTLVKRLEVTGMRLEDFSDATVFASSFSQLETLIFSSKYVIQGGPIWQRARWDKLKHLHLYSACISPLLRSLLHKNHAPLLATLTISDIAPSDMGDIMLFFASSNLTSNLESLALEFDASYSLLRIIPGEYPAEFSVLKNCVKLRDFRISHPELVTSMGTLYTILDHISTLPLQSITVAAPLEVSCPSYGQIYSSILCGVDDLDHLFSKQKFPYLKSFIFSTTVGQNKSDVSCLSRNISDYRTE